VLLWDSKATDAQNAPALKMIQDIAANPQNICYAHNAPFEIAISKYCWEQTFGCKPPALEQWRCTAALCRSAAIPSSLEQAAEFLKLDVKKDSVGKTLIRYFSIPQKKDSPTVTINGVKTHRDAAWKMFGDYCKKDVEVEKLIHKRLAPLEFKGWLLDAFQMDLRMNDRGVRVNLEAVETAESIVAEYLEKVEARFFELTGLRTSQRDKVLKWLKERGYPGADMAVGTVSRILTGVSEDDEDDEPGEPMIDLLTPEAQESLQLRAYVSFAALKKLPSMRNAACEDGKIRGMFTFWGAQRTGRTSSRIVQLHNLKRSTSTSETIYKAIRDQTLDCMDIELLYGSPVAAIASGIRHYLDPGPNREWMDVDFTAIEARVLPWLAGHDELMAEFHKGKDIYKITSAMTFGVPYDEITKDQRQLGKVIILACGFAGGLPAMNLACNTYGVKLTDKEKMQIVKAWRKANKPITDLWKDMQASAIDAIQNKGQWFRVNDKIRFGVDNKLGYPALIMELPSKRRLQYPEPQVHTVYKVKRRKEPVVTVKGNAYVVTQPDEEDPMEWVTIQPSQARDPSGSLYDGVWETKELSYYGMFKGGNNWGRVRSHGGVLVENCTQATAGDFMLLGSINAEARGYAPVMTVHDQLISEYFPEQGNNMPDLVAALCDKPAWALDFPLNAVGNLTPFFTKD
jgi:DNA polymerase